MLVVILIALISAWKKNPVAKIGDTIEDESEDVSIPSPVTKETLDADDGEE